MSLNPNPVTTFIRELAEYLQDTAKLGTLGVDLFTYVMPETPVDAMSIFALGGPKLSGDLTAIVRPQFQILVRRTTFLESFQHLEQVYVLLNQTTLDLPQNKGFITASHEIGPHFLDLNQNVISTLTFDSVLSARM